MQEAPDHQLLSLLSHGAHASSSTSLTKRLSHPHVSFSLSLNMVHHTRTHLHNIFLHTFIPIFSRLLNEFINLSLHTFALLRILLTLAKNFGIQIHNCAFFGFEKYTVHVTVNKTHCEHRFCYKLHM